MRLLFFTLCVVVTLTRYSSAQARQSLPSSLKVTIISVTDFTDRDNWWNPSLEAGFEAATDEVRQFFMSSFGVEPTILRTHAETSTEHLTSVLRDVPDSNAGTLHVVFVLSHGEVVKQKSRLFRRELYVITSDTLKTSFKSKAVTAETIVTQYRKSPDPSSALIFLDTCHSGSALTLGLQLATDFDRLFGIRTMVMAAAMPDEVAYQGLFTRALIQVWRRGGACTLGRNTIETLVSAEIARLAKAAGLSDIEQSVSLVIPYQGELCLETFTEHTALLLLYNPTKEPVIVHVFPADGARHIFRQELAENDTAAVRLNRGKFLIRSWFEDKTSTRSGSRSEFRACAVRFCR